MGSVLSDSFETYRSNLKLVLFFSIPFVIAFLIPLLAPLPIYVSLGAIFLRTASIFSNLGFVSLAIIIAAIFFSLLFLSFAFVAISLIVKSKRTHMRISRRVLGDIERYIVRVFAVLLLYTILIVIANVLGYYIGHEGLITGIVGFFGFFFIFYAPSAIVVDDKRVGRALKDGLRLTVREPQYFVLWLLLITLLVSAADALIISIFSVLWSRYIVLVLNSLVILPYFIILQAEAYMKRFPILKH